MLDVLGDLLDALAYWPGPGNPPHRVFSPGFIVFCIIFTVLELAILHSAFGGR